MASLGTPRTPAFRLLALAAAASAATTACVVALLPYFVAPNAPATALALALAAFHVPALAVHPLLRAAPPARPGGALALALLFEAAAAALFAHAAAVTPLDNAVAGAASAWAPVWAALPRGLVFGMLASGIGASLFQDQLIRHVSASLPLVHFHHDLGIHLSVISAATVSCAAAAPLLAVALLQLRAPLSAPFIVLALATLALLPLAARELLDPSKRPAQRRRDEEQPLLASGAPPEGDALRAALRALFAQPAVALPLVAMVFSMASIAFLRPILALHVLADMHLTPLFCAVAFAIVHVCTLITNNGATMLCSYTGRRPVIIAGLIFAAVGFRTLSETSWTLASIAVLASGANTALVLTLGDVAEAADMDVSGGAGDAITFITFMAMALGEAVGVLSAGAMQDKLGSFSAAVHGWSYALLGVILLLLVAELIDTWRSFFGIARITSAPDHGGRSRPPARRVATAAEAQALLLRS
jgi:hypothetical protein